MNTRMLKHLAVVAGLVGSTLSVAVANAAIVNGSQLQITGTALIDAAGNVTPRDHVTGLTVPVPVNIEIASAGNLGSFVGYNSPNNPGGGYIGQMNPILAVGPFPISVFFAPGVVVGGAEAGPAQEANTFRLDSYGFTTMPFLNGIFFLATGNGVWLDTLSGAVLANGTMQLSSQNFVAGQINSFSATFAASTTVIPVPGAAWIFGSGLLLMTAVMRRKSS